MEQQQNSYKEFYLPIDYHKSFFEFTVQELETYNNWFWEIKDERLKLFCSFLFKDKNCLKEENLKVVEMFLLNNVSTVSKPRELYRKEFITIPDTLKKEVRPDSYILDQKTISICFDISIFLGALLINIDSKINWMFEKDKNSADYGQPVLFKKTSKLKINPFRVAKNLSEKVYDQTYSDNEIIRVFEAWKRGYRS
jgi:hypothetical protein